MHRRTFFKKTFAKDELQRGIAVCGVCHKGLHALYDEMTLAKTLNTLDALKADPAVQKHVAWARKQKDRRAR